MDQLRSAIDVLYTSPNRADQHRADTWLQEFRSTPDAWALCLDLLASNALDHQAYFAANTLRYSCSKNTQLTTTQVLPQLLPKLVLCLFQALAGSKWPVVSQLSTAIAVLILRSPTWSAQTIIADLEGLVLSQYQQYQDPNTQPDPQQPTVAHLAMLQILAALPAACTDKQCSVHPNRRLAVSEALAVSAQIQPWVQAAFLAVDQLQQSQSQQLYLGLGLQLIHGWCELGNFPIILPQQANIVQRVCIAALRSETASTAAEAMVSMVSINKDVTAQGSDVLLLLVQTWQEAIAGLPADTAQQAPDVMQAVCQVLCAAAAALLPFSLGGDNVLKSHFMRIADQLLRQLTSSDDDVALTALDFWQDTYVTTLLGLPSSSRQAAISSHTHLLQHLTAGLVLRSKLSGEAAQVATADARDLPEEVRMVRRELASAIRDITGLVGCGGMLLYMASLIQGAWGALSQQGGAQQWPSLECTLYTANVVLGQGGQARRRDAGSSQAVGVLVGVCVACLTQLPESSRHPKLLGTALTLLGGQSLWYLDQPDSLRSVLDALSVTLKTGNEKLARNAATTVYRLCQQPALVGVILREHQQWVEGMLQVYGMLGGVQRRIGYGSDLPTEELLLASLCRLAMQPQSASLPYGNHLLVHLTEPKLNELRQALSGLIACAPMALQMLANASAASYTPAEQQQAVSQLDSALQADFARATAYTAQAGVCLDVLQMVTENATSGGQLRDLVSVQSTATSTCDSPRGSGGGLGGGGGGDEGGAMFRPGSAGIRRQGSVSSSRDESDMSHSSSFTSNAPGASGRGPDGSAIAGPASEQVLALLRAVWGSLQPCLPQVQALHAVMGPACVLLTCAVSNLPVTYRPEILTVSGQLLTALPPRVLVTPKGLALLTACLNNLTSCSDSSAQTGHTGEGSERCVMSARYLAPTQAAIVHSCEQAVVTCDPDLAVPTLQLCSTAVKTLSQVLTLPSTLDALLAMTRATGKTYDADQCRQWAEWIQLFVSAPYATAGSGGSGTLAAATARSQPQVKLALGQPQQPAQPQDAALPAAQSEGLAALARVLEAGAGAQLMLCILMAGSGDMPPDFVQLLAVTMHQIWHAVGTARFSCWLELAVMELATETAPWYRQKVESKQSSLQELVCPDTEYDVGRFKKLFKALCGGKKSAGKGVMISSLPGSRRVSRSPSTLSSMQMSA